MSQDMFKITMDLTVEECLRTIAIPADVAVSGRNIMDYNANLLSPMAMTAKNSLVFNLFKYVIRKSTITFYGCQFTNRGLKPDPAKIQ